jgi:hypothetical protein
LVVLVGVLPSLAFPLCSLVVLVHLLAIPLLKLIKHIENVHETADIFPIPGLLWDEPPKAAGCSLSSKVISPPSQRNSRGLVCHHRYLSADRRTP